DASAMVPPRPGSRLASRHGPGYGMPLSMPAPDATTAEAGRTTRVFSEEDRKKRWFVTGGAGFIGSHAIDLLVSAGCKVTVYDNLSLSTDHYIAEYERSGQVTFHRQDLTNLDLLTEAMKGHDVVWHLGANTDI